MSRTPPNSYKQSSNTRTDIPVIKENEFNNTNFKWSQHHHATAFVTWYNNMIDNERHNFSLYLSDDATLEWFGRTIRTRKKIAAFLNHDIQGSKHHFTTVEFIEKVPSRAERMHRMDDSKPTSPLHSPELIFSKPTKRKHLRLRCHSPEWAEGCQPNNEDNGERGKKRFKTNHTNLVDVEPHCGHKNNETNMLHGNDIGNNGDYTKGKRKCVLVTPPNMEIGQGDCLPSTSGTDSDKSHEALTAQLPKMAVECNGFIEFARTRSSSSIDSVTWERKCKVQISYSADPLNIGEYIIWLVRYHDENKCRRNLLDAFEKVSKDEKF